MNSYLHDRAEARHAGPTGVGVFATARIEAGETIVAWGGQIVTRHGLERVPGHRQALSVQLDDDLYLVSLDPEPADMVNHSCEPNCGMFGTNMLKAMRVIEAGEELTFDYAMTDATPYDEFECECGSRICRGKITGNDWLLPELQRRYRGWFSPYVSRRIADLVVTGYERRAFAVA